MSKPLLHFSHGNSFPAGTYQRFLAPLHAGFDVRALDMHGHASGFPVTDGWPGLVAELIAELESYGQPAILLGHSLGGMLSMMAAKQRPDLVRCVLMLDSPVLAGWRALLLRTVKAGGWDARWSPARFSAKRRNVWASRQAAFDHFHAKPLFAAWAPGVLDDYLEHGLTAHPDGVQLRFRREVETAIYRGLPHHLGGMMDGVFPVPIGFVGGTASTELRQAGLTATRRLVGANFSEIAGSHLFPMEAPQQAAALTGDMLARLLAQADEGDPGRGFRVKSREIPPQFSQETPRR